MASTLSRSLVTSLFAVALFAGLFGSVAERAVARPHSTPTPTASPTPSEDPQVTHIANREFVAWQAGSIDKSHYTDELGSKVTDAQLTDISTKLGKLGAFIRSEYLGPIPEDKDVPPDIKAYMYRMFCTGGTVYEQLVLDGTNKVAGILFRDKLPTP
jgi:hypothetical protein